MVGFKNYLRGLNPVLYYRALGLKNSILKGIPGFGSDQRAARAFEQLDKQRPLFPVEISTKCGMGATLSHMTAVLKHCDDQQLFPLIRLTSGVYLDQSSEKNDWFPQYFGHNPSAYPCDLKGLYIRANFVENPITLTNRDLAELSALDAHRLFQKYVRVRQDILEESNCYYSRIAAGGDVMGVHYRGSDKLAEAPRLSWPAVLAAIRARLRADQSIKSIFVASDEAGFVDYIKHELTERPVHARTTPKPPSSWQPIHFMQDDPSGAGREALVLMHILARCNVCLRTASHLSAWAKIINPNLESIALSRPRRGHVYFPEV
jgi:hypothetical protein